MSETLPWLQEVKAAHERLEKMRTLQAVEVAHTADPAALQAKLLAELSPEPIETPFDRLLARARRQQAEKNSATS